MPALSNEAIVEISRLQSQADQLLASRNMTGSDRKKIDYIISRITTIRQIGQSGDEVRRQLAKAYGEKFAAEERNRETNDTAFRMFLCRKDDSEVRTALTGSETITYTNGPLGGFLVPTSFASLVSEGAAQFDPLFDPSVVTLVQESEFKLLPLQIPGWDLSTFAASNITEATLQSEQSNPAFSGKLLNKNTYRTSLDASFEWEEDEAAYGRAQAALARAFAIGFARGIGKDLVTGSGTNAPQGILNGAVDSHVSNATAGKLSLTDITNIFFSVNKIYRSSPKCAWLMDDTSYKYLANAVDQSLRPLINVESGYQTLMGKPIYVCPSLSGNASPLAPGKIVFGDLSHFIVHASSLLIRRVTQLPGLVENAKARYTGLLMADSIVFDPTNGAVPPIVFAQIN
jgi:HK97 family phage major capsid protein